MPTTAIDASPGDIYSHHKGNKYKILTIAFAGDSSLINRKIVVYQALDATKCIYYRPVEIFFDSLPDGTMRFQKIG
jgi:hypothetical protein